MSEASLQQLMSTGLATLGAQQRLRAHQWQVCHHILDCRTEALGGLALRCDDCAHRQPAYHSCRDRHCPRCQRAATLAWCERQRQALLAVPYHHLVFTLPHQLDGWVHVHDAEIYSLLFESVWATLRSFGADPKRLDGQMGMTAVLHTWGQILTRHVHLHCLVPGGALGADGSWHAAKSTTYLFPVRALSRHVRGGFVSRLRKAHQAGRLQRVGDAAALRRMLDALMACEWVVYSKPCITHTETVVEYLGRYTHRIALSDWRLSDARDGQVSLAYKDYRDGRNKTMRLDATELIRRYLLHILPKGFMRVRHFGFLANRCRARNLQRIRTALAAKAEPEVKPARSAAAQTAPAPGSTEREAQRLCPRCRRGHLRVVASLAPRRRRSQCAMGA